MEICRSAPRSETWDRIGNGCTVGIAFLLKHECGASATDYCKSAAYHTLRVRDSIFRIEISHQICDAVERRKFVLPRLFDRFRNGGIRNLWFKRQSIVHHREPHGNLSASPGIVFFRSL